MRTTGNRAGALEAQWNRARGRMSPEHDRRAEQVALYWICPLTRSNVMSEITHSSATGPASELEEGVFEELESVAIRFAGDSGDGMQLTGTQFTNTSAVLGNDVSTMPDFPAEIRAPAGTLAGVSGFQVNISSRDIFTPGDAPQVLVAMNPAALKANLM